MLPRLAFPVGWVFCCHWLWLRAAPAALAELSCQTAKFMYFAITAPKAGELAWNVFMVVVGMGLAITGPKYLHLIDKGFPEKNRRNPAAAAKQVKTFRIIGGFLGFCGLALIALSLTGAGK